MIKNITISDLQELIKELSIIEYESLNGFAFLRLQGSIIYNSVPEFDVEGFLKDRDLTKIPWERFIEDPLFISLKKDYSIMLRNFCDVFVFGLIFNPAIKLGVSQNVFLKVIGVVDHYLDTNPAIKKLIESVRSTSYVSKLRF